ncbi:MAG: primosomal protein N' [Clostridia bacterium]|jgi:primosomal protein N' (replication factor Y)|nr:primosomal protein N' [Clostridia bacterium]
MIAQVIVDIANSEVDKIFDYKIEDGFFVQKGMRVLVSFGPRTIEGYVINITDTSEVKKEKLKSIIKILDNTAVISEEMLALMEFMTNEYNLRKVDVLRLFIPAKMRGGQVKQLKKTIVTINSGINIDEVVNSLRKNAISQISLLKYLLIQPNCESDITYLNANFSLSAVKKFLNMKVLISREICVNRTPYSSEIEAEKQNIKLTDMQQAVVDKITNDTEHNTYLLHGVTGSGKTEIYIRCIQHFIECGKTAIMLVPEISLTPLLFNRFKTRFGDSVAILHSGLSDGERYDEWNRLLNGQAKIAIGARSAVFAPLNNIGLIIIDEEHESTYASESNPRYFTHDIATFRAKYNACPILLGSATPSVDSYYKTKNGQYNLLELPLRINKHSMPAIQIVDMMSEMRAGNNGIFSVALIKELTECIKNNNQAMIFINRRGFASFVRCIECGYVAKCEDCDVSLVYHKSEEQLKCHYCSRRYKMLDICPQCGSSHIRQGAIGTQRVAKELKELFPNVKIFRMDNDTTQSKNAHFQILSAFANTKPAILVGTQMIAKGHDFKNVTVVGIIDADLSLHFTDYRSTERTFQLITQVSGRAGRDEKVGKVILQTYSPRHYVYKFVANYDYKHFFDKEINMREVTAFPPFSRIIRVLISSENEDLARQKTMEAKNMLNQVKKDYEKEFIYMEAMKSPLTRIEKKYRYQILMRIKPERQIEVTDLVYKIANRVKVSDMNIFVEINPQSLS